VTDSGPYSEIILSRNACQAESLAVVGDRRLAVAALAALLLKDPRRSVLRAARGTNDVRSSLLEFQPVVVVLEASSVEWPIGLDPHSWGGRTLLLIGPNDDPNLLRRLARPYADGYLSRTRSHRALEVAIASVAFAGEYQESHVARKVAPAAHQPHGVPARAGRALSQREQEILAEISSGHSSKEIARRCGIETKTVRNHVSNVYAKLNVHHRGQLVLYVAQHGGTAAPAADVAAR